MRRIKRHMISICTIPGIFIFSAIGLYFLSDDRPHGALNTVSEPVEKAGQVSSSHAPDLPWDDRHTVESESSPGVGVKPSRPSAAAPVLTSPEAWADEDEAFAWVRDHNGPWRIMPADRTRQEQDSFRALIRPILLEADRRLQRLSDATLDGALSSSQAIDWWEIHWWRQEQAAEAFRIVWPNARQPDPVVRR